MRYTHVVSIITVCNTFLWLYHLNQLLLCGFYKNTFDFSSPYNLLFCRFVSTPLRQPIVSPAETISYELVVLFRPYYTEEFGRGDMATLVRHIYSSAIF